MSVITVQLRKLSRMSFATDLPYSKTPILLRSEMKRWISHYQRIKKKKEKSKETAKKKKRIDGSAASELNERTDGFLGPIKLDDHDSFPSIQKLLTIGCISQISSTETERAVSGVRRIKTPYSSIIREDQGSNLNFL